MSILIYLRPLKITDAKISYKWRNDPSVWLYTGFTPSKKITVQIETEWLKNVLKRKNERRFAICIVGTNEYIGNIQLLNINNNSAEFHLFIGEKKYWGKGIGFEATKQLLNIAFKDLKLKTIILSVHPKNIIAIRCYKRAGFKNILTQDAMMKMIATSATFEKSLATA